MADFDEFNFDSDLGGFDDSDGPDGFGDLGEDGLDDFGNTSSVQTADGSDDRSGIIRQSVVIVAVGVIFILLSFAVVKWLTGSNTSTSSDTTYIDNKDTQNNNNVTQIISNRSDWLEFYDDSNLNFNKSYIDSIFTVTSIEHMAKAVDVENNLMVKTVVTGTLSGFIGTYQIDIPYSKGCQLTLGNYFDVKVEVGEYKGKLVVGDINWR